MRKKVILAGSLLLVLLLFVGGSFLLNRSYNPTIRSYLTINNGAEVAKRKDFIKNIYPLVQSIDGYPIFRLSQYHEITPYIEVRDCFPYPFIIEGKIGQPIVLANSGGVGKTVKILGKQSALGPWTRQSITPNFPAVPAIYPYYCDNSYDPAGFVYVVK